MQQPTGIDANTLSTLLSRQDALAGELLSLLDSERNALTRQALDEITALSARKQICLAHLENLAQAWEMVVQRLSDGRFGLETFSQFLATLPVSERQPLNIAWLQLKKRLSACQDLNAVNGRVIAISRRSLDRNLDLLKGKDVAAGGLYTAQGQAAGFAAYQRVQKA